MSKAVMMVAGVEGRETRMEWKEWVSEQPEAGSVRFKEYCGSIFAIVLWFLGYRWYGNHHYHAGPCSTFSNGNPPEELRDPRMGYEATDDWTLDPDDYLAVMGMDDGDGMAGVSAECNGEIVDPCGIHRSMEELLTEWSKEIRKSAWTTPEQKREFLAKVYGIQGDYWPMPIPDHPRTGRGVGDDREYVWPRKSMDLDEFFARNRGHEGRGDQVVIEDVDLERRVVRFSRARREL